MDGIALPKETLRYAAVEQSKELGRYIAATRDIPAGTLVMQSKAAAYVLADKDAPFYCAKCLISTKELESGKLLRCSQCRFAHYCSSACQRADWPAHRDECAMLKRVSPRRPPNLVRLVCKLLFRQKYDPDFLRRDVLFLSHHRSQLPQAQLEQYAQLAMLVKDCVGQDLMPSASAVMDLFAISDCNTLGLTGDDLDPGIGAGLYPHASLINHSCAPNCVVSFTGESCNVRALRSISKGEMLSINYIDLLQPRRIRQQKLRQDFFFDCRCDRCERERQSINDHDALEAFRCPSGNCTGAFTIPDDMDPSTSPSSEPINVECRTCRTIVLNVQLSIDARDRLRKEAADLKAASANMEPTMYLTKLYDLYIKQQHLLAPTHEDSLSTTRYLVESLCQHQEWPQAKQFADQVLASLESALPTNYPLVCVHHYICAKIDMWLDMFDDAYKHLELVVRMASLWHGSEHRFTQRARNDLNTCRIQLLNR